MQLEVLFAETSRVAVHAARVRREFGSPCFSPQLQAGATHSPVLVPPVQAGATLTGPSGEVDKRILVLVMREVASTATCRRGLCRRLARAPMVL